MRTQVLDQNPQQVSALLLQGGVVAFPTDTVFGLGVVYDDAKAIERMKQAKGRPEDKPFPMMVADPEQIETVAEVDSIYRPLLEVFMPGPFTIVVKRKKTVPSFAVNGCDTIAIRIPDDAFVRDVIRKAGKPLLVTSANRSGGANTTNEADVLQQLDGRITAVVKGTSGSSMASTIVDLTRVPYRMLREGVITADQIDKQMIQGGCKR